MAKAPDKSKSTFKRKLFLAVRAFGLHDESNFFIQNLAVLISSGMSVTEALQSVYEEVRSPRMRSALREIQNDVVDGLPLSQAIGRAEVVSMHTLALINLGERSGRLSQNLQVAAMQNEKEAAFRSRVRSALAYSSFVFLTALLVGVGVAWFILPSIADFFRDLNAPLPPLTRIIIATGDFLHHYGAIFIPLFVIVVGCLFYFLFSFPKTRFIGHTILFHIPFIKKLILETEVARFGFLSGSMVNAGIPIQTVFELLPSTTTFGNYREFYTYADRKINEGSTFRRLFEEYENLSRIVPLPVRQMLVSAEQSGTLSETLLKVGSIYEAKVDATSRNIPAFLEPALLLAIGVIVGVLALGILMPIYKLGFYF